MRRLVYYSLATSRTNPRPDLIWQIEASVRSLRAYNRTVPIIVFAYGDAPSDLGRALTPYNVSIRYQGSYEERLARLAPRAWPTLSHYPLLHKFLNFVEIASFDPCQVLYLDCDTLFFHDVEQLFLRYTSADCYAREEPTCGRSHYGYDRIYIDEDQLARLGGLEGIRPTPPFNLGVVLLNNGLWRRLALLEPLLISYAWRFAVWMALNPATGAAAGYGEGQGIAYLRQYFHQSVDHEDLRRALPYPSANRWILDQVALWLTLGHVSNLSYGDFSTGDVLQNGEILSRRPEECNWVVCHYFTQNMERLSAWLRHELVPA